ncbi:MAG: methylenetetrahydrofolate reductase [Proteobacteria bacterium]|nr:methylenetetrahydrofolate reductase [Pseudomonadota bacterium]MBU4582082.1 methylenetetrahydrofolate reductase [Pseudomonadota bacterium]MCG2742191.1 methylenetetrahydrofolate reductase [Syntrophaceae bacterium]
MVLAENLKKKKFVVTSEIQPPIGTGAGELVKNVERIRGRVDALTVPDLKIDGLVVDTMGTCRILREQKFDPILQTACRDRNRVELQDYLLKATAAGIENILTFTEDYRITGDSLQEIMYFHVDSGKLFSVVENIREGQDISGKELPNKANFCIGSGIDSRWGGKVPDMQLKEMEALAGFGADYFLTTPVFDLDSFHEFMKHVGPIRIPVIAEIILVRSAEMGLFLNKHVRSGLVPYHIIEKLAKAPDKERASIEIVGELVKGLKDLCQGVHLIPMGAEERIAKYLEAAKLSSL